jgi:hypothetical protein
VKYCTFSLKLGSKVKLQIFTVFAMNYYLSFFEIFKNIMSSKIFFFQQILSLSQDLCQELICVTFHDVILLTDLWKYGSSKHWLSFQIISAIYMIYTRDGNGYSSTRFGRPSTRVQFSYSNTRQTLLSLNIFPFIFLFEIFPK